MSKRLISGRSLVHFDDGHVDGDMASTVIVIDRGRIVRRVDAIIASHAVPVRQLATSRSAGGNR